MRCRDGRQGTRATRGSMLFLVASRKADPRGGHSIPILNVIQALSDFVTIIFFELLLFVSVLPIPNALFYTVALLDC